MKKNHTGSALTSVIMIFFLVALIGAPLLSMIVYNYRLREYDNGIKDSEYKNEVVMDRIATIIKNEVISAMSLSKNNTTGEITNITDSLLNYYNTAYDNAVDVADKEKLTNGEMTEDDRNDMIKNEMENSLKDIIPSIEGATKDELIGILNMDNSEDLSSGKIDNEKLQEVCNKLFKNMYQTELINNLFNEFYQENNYDDLADLIVFGNDPDSTDSNIDTRLKDEVTGRTKYTSLRILAKYGYNGRPNDFSNVHNETDSVFATFDADGELRIGIEVGYKPNLTLPVVRLSATYVIKTPEFNTVSSIEQQSIALSNSTLDYNLIVGNTLTLNGDTYIDGNILAGVDGIEKSVDDVTEIVYDKGIVLNTGARLVSGRASGEFGAGRIATPGDIIMASGTSFISGTNPLYYRNLYIGDPENQENSGEISVTFNGDVLAKDDLEINLNSPGLVDITQATGGNYFGYNDLNDDGPDSSSAIVINSDSIDKINIKLENLYLAGRAFIDGVKSTTRLDPKKNPMVYKTGESISVKGNYIAYQSPFIGSGDYNGDGVNGDYDVDKIKFSPYFMKGIKDGIEGETNLTINLADNFIVPISYEGFDTEHKWSYFLEYASKNLSKIKIPNIKVTDVKHIQGVGINTDSGTTNGLIERVIATDDSFKVSKANKFEEFTTCFGYYPADESKRKTKISDWISFGGSAIKADGSEFYTYISNSNAGSKTLAWGTGSTTGEDIYIQVPEDATSANGIIICDGDLTITNNCASDIPFNGLIIVTGNLTIEGNVSITNDKEFVSNIIIQNYLGEPGYIYTEGDNSLAQGALFSSFVYDDSGSIYVAIDVTDRSNIIDINELVGVTDWKKTDFGRL